MSQDVLLIDNDPDFRLRAKKLLQDAGYSITEAEGEKQAYEIIKNKKFTLAVVNLAMENSDSGFTLSAHFKEINPTMLIIIMSSASSEFGIDFALESVSERSWIKADAILNKPIRCEQLLQAVRRLLPQ